jgi:hypothetical protein
MNAALVPATPRDYRFRVVAFYRARAGESLERARSALDCGDTFAARFHLDEAQAWAHFAASWARKAFAGESSQTHVGEIDHG